jgi:hypothetical protein
MARKKVLFRGQMSFVSLYTRDARFFLIVEDVFGRHYCFPAEHTSRAQETHHIGEDVVECQYDTYRAYDDGAPIFFRQLSSAQRELDIRTI